MVYGERTLTCEDIGCWRTKRRFAYFPHLLASGRRVWLEWYVALWRVQKVPHDTFYNMDWLLVWVLVGKYTIGEWAALELPEEKNWLLSA